jgi:hypothetical protein
MTSKMINGLNYDPPRTATFTVAASDAPVHVKAQSDYVCDGIDDDVQIQAAIDALPATGGKICFSFGNFNAGAIRISRPVVHLSGSSVTTHAIAAPGGTILKMANGTNSDFIASADATERVLILSHMLISGNRANNVSGKGINIDYLDLGAHYHNGLGNVEIRDFPDHGIYSSGVTASSYFFASCFVIGGCGGDGIHIPNGQGLMLGLPNWICSNDGWGFWLEGGGDHIVDISCEGNGKGGAHFNVSNSQCRLWTKTNSWQGFDASGSMESNQLDIHSSNNGQNVTGAGIAADVVLAGIIDSHINMVIADFEQTKVVSGLYINGTVNNCILTGVIKSKNYGIEFNGAPSMSQTNINALSIEGVTGMTNKSTTDVEVLGLVALTNTYYWSNYFKTEAGIAIGLSGVYGAASTLRSVAGIITCPRLRIDIGGTVDVTETITVKVEYVLRDGSTNSIEKNYTAVGNSWLSDNDWWELLPLTYVTPRGIRWIRVYAKTNLGATSAIVASRLLGGS